MGASLVMNDAFVRSGHRRRTVLQLLLLVTAVVGLVLSPGLSVPAHAIGYHSSYSIGGKTRVNGGWGAYTIGHPGDMTGNGTDDVVAVDGSGRLWLYPTANPGAFGSRVQLASGWDDVVKIDGADVNGDGYADVYAERADGSIWVYLASSRARLSSSGTRLYVTWGTQKRDWTVIDYGPKGKPALLATTDSGRLELYRITSTGRLINKITVRTSGWGSFREIADGGDIYGNGRSSLLVRDNAGNIRLYSFNASFLAYTAGIIGRGFSSYHAISVLDFRGAEHFHATTNAGVRYTWQVRKTPYRPPGVPPEDDAVFVYGTLRTGERNHHLLTGTYSSKQRTSISGLALYRMAGYTVPWAVERSGYTTQGEVFWLRPATASDTIADLDRLEGYDPSEPPTNQSYVRERHTMANGYVAWVYVAGPRTATWLKSQGSVIPSGDWLRR